MLFNMNIECLLFYLKMPKIVLQKNSYQYTSFDKIDSMWHTQ